MYDGYEEDIALILYHVCLGYIHASVDGQSDIQ